MQLGIRCGCSWSLTVASLVCQQHLWVQLVDGSGESAWIMSCLLAAVRVMVVGIGGRRRQLDLS